MEKNKNIFENAKFGDKFVTRNGIVGVLLYHHKDKYTLFLEYGTELEVNEDGSYEYGDESSNDIVSKYIDTIIQEFGDACYNRGYEDANNYEYGMPEEGNIFFEEFINK